ncbi:hypothetical protein [Blastococcus saxobsidens]|uniref:Capsular polysaccharide biosynthesis protein n=1 Tax=Blastococcus saxobsidens TaxID=138336 RepID=A0A4Q7YCS3_9ACTN|nr:hypothetical protein [Blastococcus saxobsidens]RZU34454.1 capsular polysaccharide biosynthesis protein [Blastococcus saxobsidens]
MELRDYARAIAGRWVWVVTAGAVGMLLAAAAALLTPAAYQAQATLYVDAAVVADEQDPSSAARVRTTVLPSVAELASSSSVLARVADRLDPGGSPGAGLEVTVDRDASVLHLVSTRGTPAEAAAVARTVAEETRRSAVELFAGDDGPQLAVTVVEDAAAPVPASRPAAVLLVLGAAAGAGAAAVAAGLAELGRPRVRGRWDVARLTNAPVLGLLPGAALAVEGRRSPWAVRRSSVDLPDRAEEIIRLRWTLRPGPTGGSGRRIALLGAATDTGPLAAELSAPGLELIALRPHELRGSGGPWDGVLVVADGRATTAPDLSSALEDVHSSGLPLTGVVVDGLLPANAGARAVLLAGLRGDATRWLDGRCAATDLSSPNRAVPAAAQVAASRAVAVVATTMVGVTRPLPMGLSAGLLAAVALLPLWLPAVRRHRGMTLLLVLTGVGLLSGALLAWWYSPDHGFAPYEAAARGSAVLGAVGGVGVLLWARGVLPIPVLGIAFGVGMLLTELSSAAGTANLWKFQLSSPLMVIALSLAVGARRPALGAAALGVLALLNVTNDARSAFGFCVVGAALVLWQRRPAPDRPVHRRWRWPALPVVAAIGYGGYRLLTELMLAGALGAEVQQRTATQIAQTGSLLLGGRPEWTVTWALLPAHPFGFGLGTVPNSEDLLLAKAGIAVTNIPTAESYVENFMLARGVQLHSIVADLWAALGPAGALLGLATGVLVLIGLAEQLARRQASGLVCLLVPMALWGLFFGPMASNVDTLVLALGLLLRPRVPIREDGAIAAAPAPKPAFALPRLSATAP